MRLRALPVLLVAALAATTTWVAPAQAAAPTARCVASAPSRGTAAQIVGIAESVRRDLDLSAAIVRVTVGGREVVTAAVGDSMTGIPATTDMRFRTGSVGIAYLNVLLLQLVDKGTVKLDEPIARWFPSLPKANKVTLRMLGSNTSGYPDFESYAPFVKALYADPFQNWTEQEVIDLALTRNLWYEPGTNWSYSHANFVILGRILERITRTPLKQLLTRDVLNPRAPLRDRHRRHCGHSGTGPARLHDRAWRVRGLDLLEPVVDHRTRRRPHPEHLPTWRPPRAPSAPAG